MKHIETNIEKIGLIFVVLGFISNVIYWITSIILFKILGCILIGTVFIIIYFSSNPLKKLTLNWWLDVGGYGFILLGLLSLLPVTRKFSITIIAYLLIIISFGIKWEWVKRKFKELG